MNEYDNDELDDYSSGNSFRARSNTWPLNKPDLTAPSSNVCIDETLPEIELEEDDLFTTNENWSGGFVDHDIMSWDPILNAQNQQQPNLHHHNHHQHQASNNSPTVIHHQAQSQQAINHVASINDQQLQPSSHGHQRQQSIHLQQPRQISHQQQLQPHRSINHLSPHATSVTQHHAHHHQHQNSPSDQQSLESYLESSSTRSSNELMVATHNGPMHQQPSPHDHQLQHQTLNSSRCLDADDPNEYHIQMHQLRIDGPDSSRQNHYPTVITQDAANNANNAFSQMPHLNIHHGHPISEYPGLSLAQDNSQLSRHDQLNGHQHHSHLSPLTTSRFEYEPQQNDYDLKLAHDDNLNRQHLNHLEHHQHQHNASDHSTPQNQPEHNQSLSHHHIQQQQPHQSQYHDLTTLNLESNGSLGNHLLSSSMGPMGIQLSSDLENLDLKPSSLSVLANNFENLAQQSHQRQQDQSQQQSDLQSKTSETAKGELESSSAGKPQSDAASASKTKLNAQRRNAWGNMSYADLISQAIESTSDKRLTLSQIYDWMVQNVPYFHDKGDSNSSAGWKNSVRHNLSLHSRFKRLQNEGTGKSSWWTINPEANVGKCARRRAASMEASKYEKKRGRAKKRAEAIRQGLVSYPSLTNSSLNGSTNTLGEQQSQAQSLNQFYNHTTNSPSEQKQQQQPHQQLQPQQRRQLQQSDNSLQPLDQFTNQQQSKLHSHTPQLQIQMLEDYNIDQPSHQQQQHLRQLQQADRQEREQQHSCFSALDFGSNRSADVALGGA